MISIRYRALLIIVIIFDPRAYTKGKLEATVYPAAAGCVAYAAGETVVVGS
jgi:hypothetical protein